MEIPQTASEKNNNTDDSSHLGIRSPIACDTLSSPHTTGFLDLPTELRVQIYPESFCNRPERCLRLVLRQGGHIKEALPALCRALPGFHAEILQVYYAETTFRVKLYTSQQRQIFRQWVHQRGQLLRGMTSLKLGYRSIYESAPVQTDKWKNWICRVSSTLHLTLNPSGALTIRRGSRNPLGCGCGIYFGHAIEPVDVISSSIETGGECDQTSINAVVDFAYRFSRQLELSGNQWEVFKALSGSADMRCIRCNSRLLVEVTAR